MKPFNELKSNKGANNASCRYDARQRTQSGINYSRSKVPSSEFKVKK